ncbi:hypothetical protein GCM10009810_19760 [Nostocoides vanveenii]|uniref:Uncharacterized protein n=1 Tax=Nostocoides vanveenii TaxID=330835 RepID=A0ABN2KMY7_9MICO
MPVVGEATAYVLIAVCLRPTPRGRIAPCRSRRSAHDRDGVFGAFEDALAHRAEQEPTQAAAPARAQHQ